MSSMPVVDADVHSFLDAAEAGNWEFVEAWLLFDASRQNHVNDMPKGRWCALHHAAFWRSEDAARMLLKNGADPGARNTDGITPADVAIESGDENLAEFLRESPTREEVQQFLDSAKAGKFSSVEAWLLKSPHRLQHIDDMPGGRWSALHQAAWLRSVDGAQMLLKYGADPSVRNSYGRTPADIAHNNGDKVLEGILRRAMDLQDEAAMVPEGEDPHLLPEKKIQIVVGNTAKPVKQGHFDRWEWQIFSFTRPRSSASTIRTVVMELDETFKANMVELVRNQDSGSFLSQKIVGWGTFVVQLHFHFYVVGEPCTLYHMLVFDEGGSSSMTEVHIDPQNALLRQHVSAVQAKPSQINKRSMNLLKNNAELGESSQQDVSRFREYTQDAKKSRSEERRNEVLSQHSFVAEAAAGIAAMKLQQAEANAEKNQTKHIAKAAATVGATKFGTVASKELDLVVGNTAEPVLRKKNLWEWRIFVRPLQSRPPLSVSIGRVFVELHESFRNRMQQLKRVEYGQFLSRKMVGWGTFEVVIHIHLRGITQPIILRHYLSFDKGGSSSEVTIILNDQDGKSVSIERRKDVVAPLPPEQKQAVSRKGFKTRASLEASIARCKKDIDAVKNENIVTMDKLKGAEKAQSELNELLSFRMELPSEAELRDEIAKAEARRSSLIKEGSFTFAMAWQEQIEALRSKLKAEMDESSLKKGRDILHRIINSDLSPEPIPLEYLEECTQGFSDDRRLGEGAFSEVFMGKDSILKKRFAVKRLRVSLNAGADVEKAKRTFEREILTLKYFRHPNIARLYAYFMTSSLNGSLCLVFELAANGSLDSFLLHKKEKERLHWTSRINIALGISKALEYLHSGASGHVCYHRDIKAANICLRRDLCALLIDTGISKMLPEHESQFTVTVMNTTGGLLGTRGYICPYFARSMRGYNSATEVFSLGVVFAELFIGVLQNSKCSSGEEMDIFEFFSKDMQQKRLIDHVDESAGVWQPEIMRRFSHLTLEMIRMKPGDRPKIQDVVEEVRTLASQARRWSPGERNRIKVLSSAPLVWTDDGGNLHPIASSLDFQLERDLLTQCIAESNRDIKLSFDVATADRVLAAATSRCGCLHFSGHGSPNCLLLEDGTGGAHFLGSSELYDRVHQEPFQFVFVSACYSALMGKALIEAGVPHVVCCDHDEELRDDAALKFAYSFYFALAEGFTIQVAFEKGKQAVSQIFGKEENKFILLPLDSDHEKPLFDAELLDWEDDEHSANFIPSPPQRFIGREIDMYLLLQTLTSNRLVTIIGEKGIGCSSLASAVSRYIEERKTHTLLGTHETYFASVEDEKKGATIDQFVFSLQQQLVAKGKMNDEGPEPWILDIALQSVCKALRGTKALIVFDGADAGEVTLVDAVLFILKNTGDTKVLITAKAAIMPSVSQEDEFVFLLKPLDIESSALLFAESCPFCDTPDERRALHAKLVKRGSVGSSLYQRTFFDKLGGGIPLKIKRKAKSITRDEYESI